MATKAVSLICAGAAALFAGGPAGAQQAAMVRSEQSVIALADELQVLGPASGEEPVAFQVALQLRNRPALDRAIAAGRVLTAAELEQRHLPTQADYARVVTHLSAAGLHVDGASPERLAVEVSGSAAQVSLALGVHFSRVSSRGEEFVSADTAPVLPESLAPVVQSVNGLQPQLRVHPMGEIAPMSATATPYYPQAFVSGYLAKGLANEGQGSTTAIVIDTFPSKTDLTQFWKTVGSSQVLSNITFVQAVRGSLPRPSGEESMDVQVASAIAPKSKVRVYASRTLYDRDLDTAFRKLISDMKSGVKITQVSISLGGCEGATSAGQAKTDDDLFAIMSALGASVMVSSGDSGSRECGKSRGDSASFYATSPNVTAVGGTSLTLRGAGVPPTETAWKGSGGGVSVLFKAPAYQAGLGYGMRVVPDVAADANPNTGAVVIVNGRSYTYGGTSLSAPIWAGLLALVNSDRLAGGKKGLGLLNARTYPLVNTTSFRDITVGNNGGYTTAVGYDLVTGAGAPMMDSLGPTLAGQP